MRGLHELLTARIFSIDPTAAAGYRAILERNLNGHIPYTVTEKVIGRKISAKSGVVIEDTRISTESGMEVSRYNDNMDDPFINVLIIDGPMTRMGDACSYGSIDHRDMILSAANNNNCVGHIFIVNTPGGTAWTHNDYQQAIDYAHSKNQPVVMWIDGICMSAGMYLASMCDERYYMHPKDQVGCIGCMAMFYTMKNGDKDFNGETYHEIYADGSFNKNQEVRDIAENDDDTLLKQQLNEEDETFRAAIKAAFPKAKDEMTHGNVYDAEKVKGIFLEGQTDMGGAFNRVIELSKKMGNQAAVNAQSVQVSGGQTSFVSIKTATVATKHQTEQNMNKHYQQVSAILGIQDLAVKTDGKQEIENGSFLNLQQLDALEKGIGEMKAKADKADELQAKYDQVQQERDSAKNLSEQRQAQLEQLQKDNEDQKVNAATDKQTALDEQKKASEAAMVEQKKNSDEQIAALNAKIADMEKKQAEATEQIASLQQQVSDRDAQIAELAKNSGRQPSQGASPANNGTGADQPHMVTSRPVWDFSKTDEENLAIINAWKANH